MEYVGYGSQRQIVIQDKLSHTNDCKPDLFKPVSPEVSSTQYIQNGFHIYLLNKGISPLSGERKFSNCLEDITLKLILRNSSIYSKQ